MKLIPFESEKANKAYKQLYSQQGGSAIPIFSGQRNQQGHGIGSIFGSILKSALPLVKRGAMSLGKTALKTGVNIAKDGLQGKNIKQSFRDNIRQAGADALSSAVGHITNRRKPQNKNMKRKRKLVSKQSKALVKRRAKRIKRELNEDIFNE